MNILRCIRAMVDTTASDTASSTAIYKLKHHLCLPTKTYNSMQGAP